MGKMVAGGMPVPFTIRTMELLYEDKRRREGDQFKPPTSFLYYGDALWEAWGNENAVASINPKDETSGKRKSSYEKQMDFLDKMLEEEKIRDQSGSHPAFQEDQASLRQF